jgi:hypothetical protein
MDLLSRVDNNAFRWTGANAPPLNHRPLAAKHRGQRIRFIVVSGAFLLTEQKLDKIYVGVLSGNTDVPVGETRKWVYVETV